MYPSFSAPALRSEPRTHEGVVVSTNIAVPFPCPNQPSRNTGINKQPFSHISVFAPGPHYGNGSGVRGDFVGDTKHHSGAHKAVYAVAQEELEFWSTQNDTSYSPGAFGENLTTSGVKWSEVLINQQIRVGTAVLEVSVPRQPCRTFAKWLQVQGWVKKYARRGDCGAYFRVVQPGEIHPQDTLNFLAAPSHDIMMGEAFRASMGDKIAMSRIVEARIYPPFYHDRLEKILAQSH